LQKEKENEEKERGPPLKKRKNVGVSNRFVMLVDNDLNQSNLVAFSFSHGSIHSLSPPLQGLQLVTTHQFTLPHLFLLSNWTF
jgi:hypothetical protein